MTSVRILLVILSCLRSHVASVSVNIGDDVTLQCPLLPFSSMTAVSWYRQRGAEAPQLLLSYNLTDASLVTFGPGFHDGKVSVRVDRLERHWLLLRRCDVTDSAVYYCSAAEYIQQ
ncbi:secreted immunoglobulin domain 1 [Lampris incognitus]|uniref:secreted immunoglobulin domain 1 n=1 Tax=Lampris incognitus TaxID=2546036 RepID=UPI0024B5680D|nr:secreted immunoglobulin domain 1 [Lampris incognitus]XP_056133232.1 secreted immunoglobulin domain 1 [Lampris incognitus]